MVEQIFGLVLAGGKSQRMGKEKGAMVWYNKPHKYHLADLLSEYLSKVYISCRADQVDNNNDGYPALIDKQPNADSYGAIMSALQEHPDKAWLVVACDMPFIDKQSISHLIQQRDPSKIATAYFNPSNQLPEPMLAIWEPRSLTKLQQLAKTGVNCPRKALIKCSEETKLIKPIDVMSITNVNTPDDALAAREQLHASR